MSEIEIRDHAAARDRAIAAAFEPLDVPTDWDVVIKNAEDIDPDALVAELRAGEPYHSNELSQLRVWRLNQRIRIAHRHRKGLPQYAEWTCAGCGKRPADPVLGVSYRVSVCLYCEESSMLFPGEDDDVPTFAMFDPSTGSWGIAWKSKSDSDYRSDTAAIIVAGYETYDEAILALQAPGRFAQIFNRALPRGTQIDSGTLVPADRLFALDLPLTPLGWKTFVVGQMREATSEEQAPYGWEIREVKEAYFKEER